MRITATTESNPQVIGTWYSYTNNNQWWSAIRLVGWISQNVTTLQTTLYVKWQRNQYNYYPYWQDVNSYSVSIGGSTWNTSFNLPLVQKNGVYDLTGKHSFTLQHNTSTGVYSTGTLAVSGYKCWDAFSNNFSIDFPNIAVPSPTPQPDDPEEEPTPPEPLVFNDDPRYFIYADDELVYAAGIEGYEILNPKLTLEVNKAGNLQFDIPIGSAMYNKLHLMSTTINVLQGNEYLFRGRLLSTKRNFQNTLTYYCEGFFAWLLDISFIPQPFSGQARDLLKRYIERYNLRCSTNRAIDYIYSDVSAKIKVEAEEDDYSNAWNEIKKILLSNFNGYIVPYLTDNQTGIQWLSSYETSDQIIRFGENLLDFSESIDASNVFTAVRAYGKKVDGSRIALPNTFISDAEAEEIFGRIERTVIFNEDENQTTLIADAEQYLRTGTQSAMTLSVSAVDLSHIDASMDRIRVGKAVRVVSVPHEIDANFLCTKAVIDLENPANTRYTLGAVERTISELTNPSASKFVITEGD